MDFEINIAFQTALMVSSLQIAKQRFKKLHIRVQIFNILLSFTISMFLWYFDWNTHSFHIFWSSSQSHIDSSFSQTYFVSCIYANMTQVYLDLIINSIELLILFILFFVILRQKYNYETSYTRLNHLRKPGATATLFIACYEKSCYILSCQCCCCCNSVNSDENTRVVETIILKNDNNEKRKPLLMDVGTSVNVKSSNKNINDEIIELKPNVNNNNNNNNNNNIIENKNKNEVESAQIDSKQLHSPGVIPLRNEISSETYRFDSTYTRSIGASMGAGSRAASYSQYRYDSNGLFQLDDRKISDDAGLPRVLMVDNRPIQIDPNYSQTVDDNQINHNKDNEKNIKFSVIDESKSQMYHRLPDYSNTNNNSTTINNNNTKVTPNYNDNNNNNNNNNILMVDTDPMSIETYYQFDYYAYNLIIYCVTILAFISNILFLLYLIHVKSINDSSNAIKNRVLEMMLLVSVFEEGSTLLIAVLFLSTKPVKRLAKNFFIRFRLHCRRIRGKYGIDGSQRTDSDDENLNNVTETDDDNNSKQTKQKKRAVHKNIDKFSFKHVVLTKSFYQKLPILW